jgi:uncharacterized membrane protein
MKDWLITFAKKVNPELPVASATCCFRRTSRHAVFTLAPKVSNLKEITEDDVRLWAFHESCELLLAHYYCMVEDREYSSRQLDIENHRVIRVLENVVFRKILSPKRAIDRAMECAKKVQGEFQDYMKSMQEQKPGQPG